VYQDLEVDSFPEKRRAFQLPALLKYRRIARSRVFLPSAVIVLLVAMIAFIILGNRPALPFAERDWILITDFENLTGEEVFDKSLSTALNVSIEQSRYVNVFPRQRIRETLQRMRREDVAYIDESTGREIAERQGIDVLVVPSISRIGTTYVLTAVVKDVRDATVYTSEIERASSVDEVLRALDKLANRTRRVLGESLFSISRQNRPLADATTHSLEALKQYTLGYENHRAGNFHDAKMYYENALRIDSTFVLAKAGLGIMHITVAERNLQGFDSEKGKELINEAIHNLDGLTEKEKYAILVFHAGSVEYDYEKGIQHCKALLAFYPDYSSAYNNLGWYYERMGKYDDAAAMLKEAIRIDPDLMISYGGLINLYAQYIGDFDSTLVWAERWISVNPETEIGWTYIGYAYLGKDSLQQAESAFERALVHNPHWTYALYNLGHTHRLQNRYSDAIKPLNKILEVAPWESWAHYQLGVLYDLLGDMQSSRRHFENFQTEVETWIRNDPDNGFNYFAL
jgi:tetratricopeptide (TPR) repeat protein